MSYPLTGATPMGSDETARNPVQPSLPRSVPCCASPRRRGAQGRASPTLHRPRRLPRRAMHAMFPSACCCTRWCRRTTGRQRAHRPLRPRDTSPHSPRRNRNPTRCGHDPAGLDSARCRESAGLATDGEAARPREAEIPRTDVRSATKPAPNRHQTGACGTAAYPADWPRRVLEFPIRKR